MPAVVNVPRVNKLVAVVLILPAVMVKVPLIESGVEIVTPAELVLLIVKDVKLAVLLDARFWNVPDPPMDWADVLATALEEPLGFARFSVAVEVRIPPLLTVTFPPTVIFVFTNSPPLLMVKLPLKKLEYDICCTMRLKEAAVPDDGPLIIAFPKFNLPEPT